MLDTILFDLHGTLLPIDFQQFLTIYFQEMGNCFQDLIEPQILQKYVLTATHAMVENNGEQTNEIVFMEKFKTFIDKPIALFQQRFDEFYDQDFLKAQITAIHIPLIPECVNLLKKKGYRLVIATNPIFPRKAILHFIGWADLDPEDFAYISCYEQNHYCKPQPQFFQEIMQVTCRTPAQCIMVGNDSEEDSVAESLGIKTYIISDYLIQRTSGEIQCTYQGTYEDFYKFLAGLPCISD